ncbi:MAG: DUF523 and DUF1722 domain-containing protein [Nitrospirota bacterium]
MSKKIKIGISSCLIGENVRYDGGHRRDSYLSDNLGNYVKWVPVCPEVEFGLATPREPMRLMGSPDAPRLVTISTGIDHTDGMQEWAESRIKKLEREDLCGFVFKSRSPSSGYREVKVYSSKGMPVMRGRGIFAAAFLRHFPDMPVEDEERLNDSMLRENFVERIFIYHRWKRFIKEGSTIDGLVSFHTEHKLILMSHSRKHYTLLSRLVADAKQQKKKLLLKQYISLLMEGMRRIEE